MGAMLRASAAPLLALSLPLVGCSIAKAAEIEPSLQAPVPSVVPAQTLALASFEPPGALGFSRAMPLLASDGIQPDVQTPTLPAPLAEAADAYTLNKLLALPPWMDLTFTVYAAPITNFVGGLTSAANWMQQNELNITLGSGLALDPAKWREIDHWQARVRFDLYNGASDYGTVIGSAFPPQTVAIPPGPYLSGLSLLRTSRDQSLQFSVGFQSIDQDFLVAPAYLAYLYSGFNNTLNLTLPGLPITPYAAPSVVLHWQTPKLGTFSVGGYWLDELDSLTTALGSPATGDGTLTGSLQVIQWDLPLWSANAALQAPIARKGLPAVSRVLPAPLFQLGAFNTTVAFSDPVADSPTGATPLINKVIYSSLTVPLAVPIGLDNRLWGSVRWGFDVAQNPTPLFVQGGWMCQGLLPGRPLDVLSFGMGRTGFSPDLQPQLSGSGAFELNYNIRINSRLSLQPVVQWLPNPAGDGQVPGILTTSLVAALNF